MKENEGTTIMYSTCLLQPTLIYRDDGKQLEWKQITDCLWLRGLFFRVSATSERLQNIPSLDS